MALGKTLKLLIELLAATKRKTDTQLSKTKIFSIFIVIELAIVGACVWSVFERIPARQFLFPAILLFSLNGLWLVWITLKNTPK